MRRCKVKAQPWAQDWVNGYFHRWGDKAVSADETSDNKIAKTFAIVELEDGRVVTAAPDDVRFVDSPPKAELKAV